MLRRAATFLFALLAAGVATAALADVYMHGRLTLLDPALLGSLAVLGTGFMLFGVVSMRDKADDLAGRTDRLTALTNELEAFIAALEAANTRLNASEARYKGLVDSQGDAILRRTSDGRMTYANDAFFKLFDVNPEDAIGQTFHPEPHPESPPPIFGRLAGREMGRERVSYDQHVKTIAGYRWIAWEDYAIRDTDGRLVEIQSVGRDVTDRKALEAALMDARDKAQEANRAKSHFLATMSHEIRTPMNGVLGMARLILETPLAPDQKNYVETIRQSGMSLLALIEDILDFSKIESGALALERGHVNLRPLVEGVAELLATRAQAKGIEIVTAVAAGVPEVVVGDGARLRQVLTNLVGNAIKFTEEGGVLVSVTVDSGGEDAVLRISVRDTGIGVPVEKHGKIFDDFVQADSSHARRFEGTGLGLAISKRLVQAMGGTIGIEDADDRGSIFWVTLPLESADVKTQRQNAQPLASKRIGLVTASSTLGMGMKLQLEAAGAEFVEGRDVRSLCHYRNSCDLVLFDIADGNSASVPDVNDMPAPVIALLPPDQRGRLSTLGARGFRGYLMKPVRQSSLERRLAAALAGEADLERSEAAPIAAPRSGSGLSILLAEDNPVNALLARELLRRRGHSVQEVTNGEAAVSVALAGRFDLVIMDIHMPGLDGIEATRRIRSSEKSRTPIVALTADALETGRRACVEAGMDGFLTKPVDPEELDALLATIMAPRVAAA